VESFLFRCAKRYDVKGKRYFSYPSKYYCADTGLRNVRLNFRQQEESHIMENIIYNELASRGYAVDVGVVTVNDRGEDKKARRSNLEIDFIINKGMKRYYIQSALRMDDPDKKAQEQRPLLEVKDSFRKIVITKTRMEPWVNDQGVIHIGLYDFLLDESVMDL
jgi:predicted AAA+ superfamily ATPase